MLPLQLPTREQLPSQESLWEAQVKQLLQFCRMGAMVALWEPLNHNDSREAGQVLPSWQPGHGLWVPGQS